MASKPTHRITIRTGAYKDRDGNEKFRSKEVGTVFAKDDGSRFIMFDATFLSPSLNQIANKEGQDRIPLGVWPIEEREGAVAPKQAEAAHKASTAKAAAPAGHEEFSDDIPF